MECGDDGRLLHAAQRWRVHVGTGYGGGLGSGDFRRVGRTADGREPLWRPHHDQLQLHRRQWDHRERSIHLQPDPRRAGDDGYQCVDQCRRHGRAGIGQRVDLQFCRLFQYGHAPDQRGVDEGQWRLCVVDGPCSRYRQWQHRCARRLCQHQCDQQHQFRSGCEQPGQFHAGCGHVVDQRYGQKHIQCRNDDDLSGYRHRHDRDDGPWRNGGHHDDHAQLPQQFIYARDGVALWLDSGVWHPGSGAAYGEHQQLARHYSDRRYQQLGAQWHTVERAVHCRCGAVLLLQPQRYVRLRILADDRHDDQ